MKHKLFVLAFFLSMTGATCNNEQPPREVVVVCTEGGDAGAPEPFDVDTSAEAMGGVTPCARACRNLATLGCPEAWKLPGGRTCVENCKAMLPVSPYDPECVAAAKTVDAVRKCPALTCKR